ncbi:MAG: transcriptional regulator [Deltaproteobacteria bacterium]|nr:transcriptional regulator [Deltaproteobacteria bacterium]
MEKKDFAAIRKKLGKTQKEIAILLGISLKAVCSYEQGWRAVPGHVERQLLFLLAQKRNTSGGGRNCWELKNCPDERRNRCPAWEFNSGKFCWFISGTICECSAKKSWKEKIDICKNCIVMKEDNR